MIVETEAYAEREEEGLRTERTCFPIAQVCRYQECSLGDMPGTAVWLRDGGAPTITMGFDDFDRLYREHTGTTPTGGFKA